MARGTVVLRRGLVLAMVHSREGVMIWADNSHVKAWPKLMDNAREVAWAASLMEEKGQIHEPWDVIVRRAPKL